MKTTKICLFMKEEQSMAWAMYVYVERCYGRNVDENGCIISALMDTREKDKFHYVKEK